MGMDSSEVYVEAPQVLVKAIIQEFREHDTAQEKSIRDYIQKKGGAKTVIKSNDHIKALARMANVSLSELSDDGLAERMGDMATTTNVTKARKHLEEDVNRDVAKLLHDNFVSFQKKLTRQQDGFKRLMDSSEQRILKAIFSGAYERVDDPVNTLNFSDHQI